MRKWIGLVVLLFGLLALPQNALGAVRLTTEQATQRKQLQTFVQQQLLTKQGIYTNYLDTSKRGATASGHEMLSESAGYYLQHLVLTQKKQAFRSFYQQTVKTFYANRQFSYRYDPRTQKRAAVNASVDDLRLIGNLLSYDQTFKTQHYQKTAAKLYRDLREHSLINGRLYDFADGKTGKHAQTITLCYLDLKTLRHFENNTARGRQQWRQQLKLIKNGSLGSVAPLYKTRYNYQRKVYTNSEELNIVESLLTMQHLAEVDQLPQASQRWLQKQVTAGKLYNRYDQQGNALTKDQSAGGYALAAAIGKTTGNAKLYQAAMQHVASFQVTTQSSPLYGGLGDATTQQAYSFDNLTALVAYDLAL